jgi:hypothetical protein
MTIDTRASVTMVRPDIIEGSLKEAEPTVHFENGVQGDL